MSNGRLDRALLTAIRAATGEMHRQTPDTKHAFRYWRTHWLQSATKRFQLRITT